MVARHVSAFELLHSEMRNGFREIRDELSGIRRDMLHLTIGMIGAFAALFAALVAQSF